MTNIITKRKNQKKTELNNYLTAINNDAEFIDIVHNCVSQSLDANMARTLITKKTYDIFNLIQDNDKHELKCFYALHAILLALVSDKCNDVLNEMSDRNLDILSKCIFIAKKRKCPDIKIATDKRDMRQADIDNGITQNSMINNSMIKSAQIAINVGALWNDAVAELQKWSDAVNVYKRPQIVEQTAHGIESQPEIRTEPKEENELWSLEELSDKLGNKNKHALQTKKCDVIKKNPDRADEIKNWFVCKYIGNKGQKHMFFKAKYFGELQKLWGKKSENKYNNNPSETKKQEKTNESVATFVDVQAFVTYIKGLEKLYKKADEKLKAANTKYADAMQSANNAKLADRMECLKYALKVNDSVLKNQAEFDDIKQRLDNANKLLQDKKQAIETLRAVDAEIAKILQKSKQK